MPGRRPTALENWTRSPKAGSRAFQTFFDCRDVPTTPWSTRTAGLGGQLSRSLAEAFCYAP
jgi:hypothetical protein